MNEQTGTWTKVSVTAASHDSAVRKAQSVVKKRNQRVRATGTATRGKAVGASGKSNRWAVELLVSPTEDDGASTTT